MSALLAVALLAVSAAAPAPHTVTTADGPRRYLLVDALAPGARPLVLLLHGHGGSAERALGKSPLGVWAAIAMREGVVVAALEGAESPDGRQGWNDCRNDPGALPATDDVAFARAVIDELVRAGRADPKRVYAMGMSNGAMMALRLALELDRPLAAVAAACGLMADQGACDAARPRPISALLIAGTADPLVPFEGGVVARRRGKVLSAALTADWFRRADGLADQKPVEAAFAHREGSDKTRAVKLVWGEPGGLQVALIRVEGGGHAEPTLSRSYGFFYRAATGKQNHDFESAEEAWAFFKDKRAQ